MENPPSLRNIKVVPIGENLWDVYRVNNSITQMTYIGQVSVDPFGYDIKDVIPGNERTVDFAAQVINFEKNREFCIRLLTGKE